MSFNALDDILLATKVQEIGAGLNSIQQQVSAFEAHLKRLGSGKFKKAGQSDSIKNKIRVLIPKMQECTQNVNISLKSLSDGIYGPRLRNEFDLINQRVSEAYDQWESIKDQEQEIVQIDDRIDVQDYGTCHSQQTISKPRFVDCDVNTFLITERATEIQRIEEDAVLVGQIFQKIGTLVVAQRDTVNLIEEGIQEAEVTTCAANRELNAAQTKQHQQREWCCGILVVLVFITFVLTLILVAFH
jgi:hypothetical protein